MLSLITSTAVFSFLIWMGNILMFLGKESYWLIPCFFLLMLNVRLFYNESNCLSLQFRDFLFTGVMTLLFSLLLLYWRHSLHSYECCYLYLVTFLSLVLYANSVRFKSLM